MDFELTHVLFVYKRHLSNFCAFSDEAWNLLEEILEVKQVSKGTQTVQQGKTCRFIDYVHEGSFRAFRIKGDEEVTTALYVSDTFVTDMKSLSSGKPSELFIQAFEESTVVRLYKERLINLYKLSAELQTVGRAILEGMVVAENEWKQMYTLYDPQERYRFLLERAPEYLKHFPLQYIASFLAMRRETLSRIRGRQ